MPIAVSKRCFNFIGDHSARLICGKKTQTNALASCRERIASCVILLFLLIPTALLGGGARLIEKCCRYCSKHQNAPDAIIEVDLISNKILTQDKTETNKKLQQDMLQRLPKELVKIIVSYLHEDDCNAAMQVNRMWRKNILIELSDVIDILGENHLPEITKLNEILGNRLAIKITLFSFASILSNLSKAEINMLNENMKMKRNQFYKKLRPLIEFLSYLREKGINEIEKNVPLYHFLSEPVRDEINSNFERIQQKNEKAKKLDAFFNELHQIFNDFKEVDAHQGETVQIFLETCKRKKRNDSRCFPATLTLNVDLSTHTSTHVASLNFVKTGYLTDTRYLEHGGSARDPKIPLNVPDASGLALQKEYTIHHHTIGLTCPSWKWTTV